MLKTRQVHEVFNSSTTFLKKYQPLRPLVLALFWFCLMIRSINARPPVVSPIVPHADIGYVFCLSYIQKLPGTNLLHFPLPTLTASMDDAGCTYDAGTETVDCVGLSLTEIPDDIPPSTLVLMLDGNALTIVDASMFTGMALLEKLSIVSSCVIEVICFTCSLGYGRVLHSTSGNTWRLLPPTSYCQTSSAAPIFTFFRLKIHGNKVQQSHYRAPF